MKYHSKITITNSSENSKTLCLEPWAEEFEMDSEMKLEIVVKSDEKGEFEIDFGEERITVYTWGNAVAEVLFEGENISAAGHILLPFPNNKMSLSKTIEWLFGKN